MAAQGTVNSGFRLLELIFLLIPVVAILLQTMISFYSTHGTHAPDWKKGAAFTAALFGLVFFGYAGVQVIQLMSRNNVNSTIINASIATLFGLGAIAVAVIITITDVFGSSQEKHSQSVIQSPESRPETRERRVVTGDHPNTENKEAQQNKVEENE